MKIEQVATLAESLESAAKFIEDRIPEADHCCLTCSENVRRYATAVRASIATRTTRGSPMLDEQTPLSEQFSELWAKPGVRAALERLREVVGDEVHDAAMAYYGKFAESQVRFSAPRPGNTNG